MKTKDKLKNAIYKDAGEHFEILPVVEMKDKDGNVKNEQLNILDMKKQNDLNKINLVKIIQEKFPNALFMIFSHDDGIMGIYKDNVVNAEIVKNENDKFDGNFMEYLMDYKTRDQIINNFLTRVDGLIYNLTEPKKNKDKQYAKKTK